MSLLPGDWEAALGSFEFDRLIVVNKMSANYIHRWPWSFINMEEEKNEWSDGHQGQESERVCQIGAFFCNQQLITIKTIKHFDMPAKNPWAHSEFQSPPLLRCYSGWDGGLPKGSRVLPCKSEQEHDLIHEKCPGWGIEFQSLRHPRPKPQMAFEWWMCFCDWIAWSRSGGNYRSRNKFVSDCFPIVAGASIIAISTRSSKLHVLVSWQRRRRHVVLQTN